MVMRMQKMANNVKAIKINDKAKDLLKKIQDIIQEIEDEKKSQLTSLYSETNYDFYIGLYKIIECYVKIIIMVREAHGLK